MKIFVIAHGVKSGGSESTCLNTLKSLLFKIDLENDYFILVPEQVHYTSLLPKQARLVSHYYKQKYGAIW